MYITYNKNIKLWEKHSEIMNANPNMFFYGGIPSGNQTWQWKIPDKWSFLARKITDQWSIFQPCLITYRYITYKPHKLQIYYHILPINPSLAGISSHPHPHLRSHLRSQVDGVRPLSPHLDVLAEGDVVLIDAFGVPWPMAFLWRGERRDVAPGGHGQGVNHG